MKQLPVTSPFPPSVALVVADYSGNDSVTSAHSDELALLSPNASPKRRREFSAGRAAAREALLQCGCPLPALILRHQDREPCWPDGYIGSLSHCRHYAAAAVGRSSEWCGIGLDLEHSGTPRMDISDHIALPSEKSWIEAAPHRQKATLLLFSAKEAIYKCLYPTAQTSIGFMDVEINPQGDQLQAVLLRPLKDIWPQGFLLEVHYQWLGDLLLTTTAVSSVKT